MEKVWPTQKLSASWGRLTGGSVNRQIFGAAIRVGVLTALVKAAIVVRELVVAWRFGTGDALDAFIIASLVPLFVVNIAAGSFNAAFIPTYIRVREREGPAAAQDLFSSAVGWSACLLVLVSALVVLCAPLYLPLLGSGFGAEKLRTTFRLLSVIAPVVFFSGLASTLAAALNAAERFALAATLPVLTPLAGILFLLLAPGWGVYAIAVGIVFGSALELTLLALALWRHGVRLRPRLGAPDAHTRDVAGQYVPVVAGALLMGGTNLVDQAMAATLPAGSVASLTYGGRVVGFLLALGATALGTVLVPYFSGMAARSEWARLRGTLSFYLKTVFLVCVPLTALLVFGSAPLVQILFQRGSFTPADTGRVALVQSLYALQIPFYVAGILVVRLISALRANRVIMWAAALSLLLNVALNYLFMRRLGVAGIALSTSVVYLFSFAYCWARLARRLAGTERGEWRA
ncbi:MAG TPA: lipid II flippase MurJ [Pyrinomonadaceae bacterium]